MAVNENLDEFDDILVSERKKKRRKKTLLLLALLLLLLFLAAGGTFITIMLLNDANQKGVALKLTASTYQVTEGEGRGESTGGFSQTFKKKDKSMDKQVEFDECVLTPTSHYEIDYVIDNKASYEYVYTIDFTGLTGYNYKLTYYYTSVNQPSEAEVAVPQDGIVTFNEKADVELHILIKIDNSADNAHCEGIIKFTVALA